MNARSDRPAFAAAGDSGDLLWLPVAFEPGALEHYGGVLGLAVPEEALAGLARAIASSPGWRGSGALVIARPRPRPVLAIVGRFDPAKRARLELQAQHLGSAVAHLRYESDRAVREACCRLAERLRAELGDDGLARARFRAIPRGGLVVLGQLAILLDLDRRQLEPPYPSDLPLVVVDDCAVSGLRFAQVLAQCRHREIVFAPLYSHPRLRAAVREREPRVAACVSGSDLGEVELEGLAPGAERRWRLRLRGTRYWIGRPETLCFAWSEPDRLLWDAAAERSIAAWRVVPPELCLKNRPRPGRPAIPVALQPPGRGRLRPADTVLYADFEDCVLVGELESGVSYRLSGSGADVWRALARHGDGERAIVELEHETDAERPHLEREVGELIADLLDRGLLVERSPLRAAGGAYPA